MDSTPPPPAEIGLRNEYSVVIEFERTNKGFDLPSALGVITEWTSAKQMLSPSNDFLIDLLHVVNYNVTTG